jgi:hypothetical protein
VTAQGTRAVAEREQVLSLFPDRTAAEEVLGQLIDARLLTSYEVEGAEGRTVSTVEAMDRTGRRHRVVTHLAASQSADTDAAPSTSYVDLMLRGSRHWSLPAGWIAGLEEFVQGTF